MTFGTIKSLLLYPPITDPTSGYHSLSYLQAYARTHGHGMIDILDANIEALDHMAHPERVERVLAVAYETYARLGNQNELSGEEQLAYYHAWLSRPLNANRLQRAFQTMRNREEFYNYKQYHEAAQTIMHWIKCLSLLGFPGQFAQGFALEPHGRINLNRSGDLTDWEAISRASGAFMPYFNDVLLPGLSTADYGLIGINITYVYQLPFALWLLRTIKERFPHLFLVAGGTEVSDIWKYSLDSARFREIFGYADACIVGEGESAFVHVLDCLAAGRPLQAATNLILPRSGEDDDAFLPLKVSHEELAEIPTPSYSDLPWQKYLAPEPFVYYSPSRGCYWNKCTFCDYGLNFGSPTSPWRSDPVDKIIDDLREIANQSKFIYFSVDVLAPATLLKLAERIVAEGLDIRWGAEIRLEAYWSRERCQLLKQSGCVAISVGFESGNQRVLDLIDKGTRPDRVAETIRSFDEAGIGVQMMGFTGFPSETEAEAHESVEFLRAHRDHWTFGGLGTFVLTPGAIVARAPERFGIYDVKPYVGEDIVRHLAYRDPVVEEQSSRNPNWQKRLSSVKGEIERAPFPRPFLGGVDTPHTLMFHDRYGTDILQTIRLTPDITQMTDGAPLALNGEMVSEDHGFAVDRLLHGVDGFYKEAASEGKSSSYLELNRLLGAQRLAKEPHNVPFFMRRDGSYMKLTKPLHRLLCAIAECGCWGAVHEQLCPDGTSKEFYRTLLGFCFQFRLVTSDPSAESGTRVTEGSSTVTGDR